MAVYASYNGDSDFAGIIFPLTYGCRPSAFTLYGHPKTLTRGGSLGIYDTDAGVSNLFPDCVHTNVTEIGSVNAYHFQDRRARLSGKSFWSEFNIPIAGGPTLRQESSPQDIASQLLDDMGETGADVSAIPNSPRPYICGTGQDPRDALDALCRLLGCRMVLGLDNVLKACRLGTGIATPTTDQILEPLEYSTGAHPESIAIDYEPTRYQSWLKLESQDASLSSVPWLSSNDQLRFYRISDTYPVGLDVPGYGIIGSIDDIYLEDFRAEAIPFSLSWNERALPRVYGKFHTGQYCGVTSSSLTEYELPFTIHKEQKIVEFRSPVFQTDGNGISSGCSELYLETAYQVRLVSTGDYSAEPVRHLYSNSQSGDVASLQHRIPQMLYDRWISRYDGAGNLYAVDSNRSSIESMGASIISAAEPLFQQRAMEPKRNAGVLAVEPDGIIEQVTWGFGLPTMDYGSNPMTWIGGECSPYAFGSVPSA